MRALLKLTVASGLLSIPLAAAHAGGYICIAKHATGFRFDSKTREWEPTVFRSGTKYLLKKGGAGKWTWAKFGDTDSGTCDAPNAMGFLECADNFSNVIMNNRTMRYTLVARHGYVQFPQERLGSTLKLAEGSQAPMIEIGECAGVEE